MVDFSKFDQMIDSKKLKEDIKNAADVSFDEVPAGTYVIGIEKMEIKPTKAGDKLMFALQAKIKKTIEAPKKQDNRYIFFNRVISGNKVSDNWNDGVAIKGVITWLDELGEEIEFDSYSQFAEDVNDIFEELHDSVEVEVEYDPKKFNPISIVEVYDI